MYPEPLFFIFGFPIYVFGLLAALGLAAGYGIIYRMAHSFGLDTGLLPDLIFAVMIPALIGARLFFIFEHAAEYITHPLKSLQIWEGGLMQWGGIWGGLAGGLFFCRRHKISFLQYADAVAFGLCLGFAISRLGCFAAGCCYGIPSPPFWGVVFAHPLSLAQPHDVPLHPVQLYSFLTDILILTVLFKKQRRFAGDLFFTYLILATTMRLSMDLLRTQVSPIHQMLVLIPFFTAIIFYTKIYKPQGGMIMKQKSFFKLASLFAAAVFLTACGIISTQKVTRGHDISSTAVNSLLKGQSTEKDVLKLFGPPTKVRDTEDGKEFLYEYASSGGVKWNLLFSVGGGTKVKTLMVWLDKNDVVTDYAFKVS